MNWLVLFVKYLLSYLTQVLHSSDKIGAGARSHTIITSLLWCGEVREHLDPRRHTDNRQRYEAFYLAAGVGCSQEITAALRVAIVGSKNRPAIRPLLSLES